jgi:glutamate racemase
MIYHPIGVFDSGVGGLSVLRALRTELPSERFVYIADSGHAPYGERDDTHVLARAHAIADHLVLRHGIKALVVACNTATATAIGALRQRYANLPIIGIEPALKPAAAASSTHVIGVMATRGTLTSEKFRSLLAALHGQATFVLQPCDGLAHAIESDDAIEVESACARYTRAMGTFGPNPGNIDMLVMGCTHYPFADAVLRAHVGSGIVFWEGGVSVAQQTRRLLADGGQLRPELAKNQPTADTPLFFTTGSAHTLAAALQRWLHLDTPVHALAIE